MSDLILTATASLVSSVEVRRSTWLTAVQAVWVPRQSFLLQNYSTRVKVSQSPSLQYLWMPWICNVDRGNWR